MSADHDTAFTTAVRNALHEDVSAPPSLLPDLHKRYARRVVGRRAALVGVPLAVALVIGVATTAGSPVSAPAQVVDAATSSRITGALDDVEGDVIHSTAVETGEGKYSRPDHPAVYEMWALADRSRFRSQVFVDGLPVYENALYPGGMTTVDHRSRTWRQTQDSTSGGKQGGYALDLFTPARIKDLITAGRLRVVDEHEVVGGRPTIHLEGEDVGKLSSPVDLWVDRETSLPIRSQVEGSAPAEGYSPAPR
jgi:hypothetical protein